MILFAIICAYIAFNFSRALKDGEYGEEPVTIGLDLLFGFFIWAFNAIKKLVKKPAAPKA